MKAYRSNRDLAMVLAEGDWWLVTGDWRRTQFQAEMVSFGRREEERELAPALPNGLNPSESWLGGAVRGRGGLAREVGEAGQGGD